MSRMLQLAVICCCLAGLSTAAFAQKKKTVRKPAARPAPAAANSFIIRDEAGKVGIQIKNVTRFIYLLGGVAGTIEAVDKDARAGKVSRAGLRANDANKQTVLQTIRNVRAGIVQLEGDFTLKPELRPFRIHIQGISELSGIAEEQATGGQFVNAGKSLLEVVNRLTDTLQNLK